MHATCYIFYIFTVDGISVSSNSVSLLRFAYSTPQYSHVTPMLNSTLSINLDGIITFRPALVVVCSIIKSNVSIVINVLLAPVSYLSINWSAFHLSLNHHNSHTLHLYLGHGATSSNHRTCIAIITPTRILLGIVYYISNPIYYF